MSQWLIAALDLALADLAAAQFVQIGWTKPVGYFHACLTQQQAGSLTCYVAHVPPVGDRPAQYMGHAKLVWTPDYPPFRRQAIPEIQDLNVLPAFRRHGIGTALIHRCEALAASRSTTVGIGVGLHPGYNAAQRLYSRLGYVLDGNGVHYEDQPVVQGASYRFDDDLVIYFTKSLAVFT